MPSASSSLTIGRPIGHLRLGREFPDLEAMVREAIETPVPVEREVQASDGRSYSVRVRPYRAAGDRIEGAVVSFIDIDDLKRTERELREARDVARATFETVREPLVTLDASLHARPCPEHLYPLLNSSARHAQQDDAKDAKQRRDPSR